jgi:hypothetical protein
MNTASPTTSRVVKLPHSAKFVDLNELVDLNEVHILFHVPDYGSIDYVRAQRTS